MRLARYFLILAALAGLGAGGGDLPEPFRTGARWEYEVRVAGLNVGTVVRSIIGPNKMKLEVNTDSSERNGTILYDLEIYKNILGARRAVFTPSADGKAFDLAECNPPLPLFVLPGTKEKVNYEYDISCRRDNEKIAEGKAYLMTEELSTEVSGIDGAHMAFSSTTLSSDILNDAYTYMHPEKGVVAIDMKLNWLMTSNWRLKKFTPAPAAAPAPVAAPEPAPEPDAEASPAPAEVGEQAGDADKKAEE